MAKTYTLDGGIRVTRTLRDIARSIAGRRGCSESEAAHSFFGGEVLESWKRQYTEETGGIPEEAGRGATAEESEQDSA